MSCTSWRWSRSRRWVRWSERQSRTVFGARLAVLTVSSAIWQETVTGIAELCAIPLIDISEPTENVLWEVEELVRRFGDRCVFIGAYEQTAGAHDTRAGPPDGAALDVSRRSSGPRVPERCRKQGALRPSARVDPRAAHPPTAADRHQLVDSQPARVRDGGDGGARVDVLEELEQVVDRDTDAARGGREAGSGDVDEDGAAPRPERPDRRCSPRRPTGRTTLSSRQSTS